MRQLYNTYRHNKRLEAEFRSDVRSWRNYKFCPLCYERIGKNAHRRTMNTLATDALKRLGI